MGKALQWGAYKTKRAFEEVNPSGTHLLEKIVIADDLDLQKMYQE